MTSFSFRPGRLVVVTGVGMALALLAPAQLLTGGQVPYAVAVAQDDHSSSEGGHTSGSKGGSSHSGGSGSSHSGGGGSGGHSGGSGSKGFGLGKGLGGQGGGHVGGQYEGHTSGFHDAGKDVHGHTDDKDEHADGTVTGHSNDATVDKIFRE